MALYVVEREIGTVPPDQLRLDQLAVASACTEFKSQGRRIRYISSAVVPADGRTRDLFGAETAEVVKDAHLFAHVPYVRIVEILDLTPIFVQGTTSRPRRSPRRPVGPTTGDGSAKGIPHAMTTHSAPELARWLADGQRFFAVCVETLEHADRLQARNHTLERENEMLREEVVRLRQKVDILQTDRAEMVAAFNDLAGHVTQVVDHILQKADNNEEEK